MSGAERDLDLMDALTYGDVFDCAVTLDEIATYSLRPASRDELAALVDRLVAESVIGEHDGYYHLSGRQQLARERAERQRRSARLTRRARRVASIVKHMPFVRGIYMTGSVAADNAGPDADLDLLFIVADGRLGLAFMQFGPLARLVSRRFLCPNYYLAESHLGVDRHTLYVAREVAQARPLVGQGNLLVEANPWVRALLPNARPDAGEQLVKPGSLLQSLLELPLRGRFGDWLDRWARTLSRRRLEKHYADRQRTVPPSVVAQLERSEALRFHALTEVETLHSDYLRRRSHLATTLDSRLERIQPKPGGAEVPDEQPGMLERD